MSYWEPEGHTFECQKCHAAILCDHGIYGIGIESCEEERNGLCEKCEELLEKENS